MSKSLNLLAGTALAAGLIAGPAMAEKLGLGRVAVEGFDGGASAVV